MPKGPRVVIPPPLIFVATYLAGLAINTVAPLRIGRFDGGPVTMVAPAIVGIGTLLVLAGVLSLAVARTAIIPHHEVRTVVTTGIYRHTRNPIYLGFLVAYLGTALWRGDVWPLFTLPFGLGLLKHYVIDLEEAHLQRKFGRPYEEYQRRVRRWI